MLSNMKIILFYLLEHYKKISKYHWGYTVYVSLSIEVKCCKVSQSESNPDSELLVFKQLVHL